MKRRIWQDLFQGDGPYWGSAWQSAYSYDQVHGVQVIASGYGQSLPWYFPVLPSYWRPLAAPGRSRSVSGQSADGGSGDLAGVDAAVAIRHLCKDFVTTDGTVKRAVDDLSLDIPAQQVTALLGESSPRHSLLATGWPSVK